MRLVEPVKRPRRVPTNIAGWLLVGGGLGVVVWLGVDRPSSESAPRASASVPSRAPEGSTGSRTSRQRGWIPPEATEATEVAALRADAPCRDDGSLVDTGKAVAVSLERELREATKVSDDEESRIGQRLEAGVARERSMAGKWDTPEDAQRYGGYLNDLVRHIAKGKARRGIEYRAHLLRRPDFNAGALPGGVLLVHTGALEGKNAVQDEAELVAVLGHEIAHVEKRHTMAAYQYARAVLGEDAEEGIIAMKILTTPISSEYEFEADDHGLELAVAAQYDPVAAVNLWSRRAKSERAGPGGAFGEILEDVDAVFRSHPKAAARACRAAKRVQWARDNAPWERLYDGRNNLRTRVIGPTRTY